MLAQPLIDPAQGENAKKNKISADEEE